MSNDIEEISFNDLLFSMVGKDNNGETNDRCLIENEPLEENHITLECNHKFNYDAIFNEIKAQKSKNNTLEVQRLKPGELKCPYCRKIQKKLLPPREGYPKLHGINEKPLPKIYGINSFLWGMTYRCHALMLTGKNKGKRCNNEGKYKFCVQHKFLRELYSDYVFKPMPLKRIRLKRLAPSILNYKITTNQTVKPKNKTVDNLKSKKAMVKVNVKVPKSISVEDSALWKKDERCVAICQTGKNAGKRCK